MVTKLDRVGWSVGNLIEVIGDLGRRSIDLIVLDQTINTSTPAGRMLFHVLAAIAERDLAAERTRNGLAAARARHGGKLPPRGPSISPDKLAASPTTRNATKPSSVSSPNTNQRRMTQGYSLAQGTSGWARHRGTEAGR